MAISTYKTYLMYKPTSSWQLMCPIKDFPDLGGAPEMLETTTLSDGSRTYILGLQEQEAMEFTANYDYETYQDLVNESEGGIMDMRICFGSTTSTGANPTTTYGTEGYFQFKGSYSMSVVGGGVNEVVDMKITIAPSTPLIFAIAS